MLGIAAQFNALAPASMFALLSVAKIVAFSKSQHEPSHKPHPVIPIAADVT
jgi:hypothetical protein